MPIVQRPSRLQLIPSTASPQEAAAIVAALEHFVRATRRAPRPPARAADPWRRAAILEGVGREDPGDLPDPWINT
jgi:hypothetical protein